MIHIAAARQSDPHLTNHNLSQKLGNPFLDAAVFPAVACNCAFIGYSSWRREDNGDANLADEQVFVVRDGQVQFLNPRNDLVNHSPDGLSWGYSGSSPAQLAVAMLMEIFNDWDRVQPIYQCFKDRFVAKIPQNTNWTADGSDVMAMALAIEAEKTASSGKSAANSSAAKAHSGRSPGGGRSGSENRGAKSQSKEESDSFLKALQAFREAAITLNQAWDDVDDGQFEESPLFESYPFDQSFEEVVSDICGWVENFCKWVKSG